MALPKLTFFLLAIFTLKVSGQTVDSVSFVNNKTNKNFVCHSYQNWLGLHKSRCSFEDGKKRYASNANILRVLHGKTWDKQGRLIRRSKQYPFGSTAYTLSYTEKTYDQNGHLIRYEHTKEFITCFRSPKIIRQKIIEYDEKGNIIKRSKHK